jgi:signal transduction histidine kinase
VQFDPVTLLAVHGLVSLSLEVLLVAFWLVHRRVPGLGLWAVANALLGIATTMIARRPSLSPFVAGVVDNALLFAGLAVMWNGVRRFNGRPSTWRLSALGLAIFTACMALVVLVLDDYSLRVAVTSAAYAALLFAMAYELVRWSSRRVRHIAMAAALLMFGQGASFAVRVVRALAAFGDPDVLASSVPTTAFLLITIIVSILTIMCLVMLAAQWLQAELEVALVRVEAASRGKSEFLATMSHELRTPLNAILGFSDVMRQQLFGPLGVPRYRSYAEDIHASGTHLRDLISTLLDVSKAEAGKLEVSPETVDVARIARAAVRLLQESAGKRGVKLELVIADPTPACWADERALKQILLNLLSNAIKFTSAGGRAAVTVDAAGPHGVTIAVRDTGIGIAADQLPRLLKPFEQASNAYSRAEGGTGLGLPLVDALVRLHGGELRIVSALGRGTEARVWLPAQAMPEHVGVTEHSAPSAAAAS